MHTSLRRRRAQQLVAVDVVDTTARRAPHAYAPILFARAAREHIEHDTDSETCAERVSVVLLLPAEARAFSLFLSTQLERYGTCHSARAAGDAGRASRLLALPAQLVVAVSAADASASETLHFRELILLTRNTEHAHHFDVAKDVARP
jgi:hypothetical protein